MTLRCFVLEDQAPARRVIEAYAQRLGDAEVVGSAAVPAMAATALATTPVDVLILDLGLPQQDGFAFLSQLADPPVVIVTTAFGERALEGFDHGVADYLLKPFSFDRFRTAVQRARLALQARRDTSLLPVPLDRGRHEFVRIGDIVSLSADGDYVVIRTTAGKLYTLGPLTSWLDRLPTPPFLRVHRSHVVNVDHVTGMDGRTVRAGDETLPVSATHAGEVRALLAGRG